MEWPKDETTGKVSTTIVNKRIWKAFLAPLLRKSAVDDEFATEIRKQLLQDTVEISQGLDELPNSEWRKKYPFFVNSIIQIQARATPEEALSMCQAGLDAVHSNMRFATTNEGAPSLVLSAKDSIVSQSSEQQETFYFDSLVLYGQKEEKVGDAQMHMEWKVPSSSKIPNSFRNVSGDTIKKQLQALVNYGCMEPSAASAASEIMVQKTLEEISESLKDKVFVLLGATSELGPVIPLAQLGATIVAVARPGKKLEALIQEIQTTTKAELILPVKIQKQISDSSETIGGNNQTPGADLLHDTPQLARWIASLCPQKQLVIVPLAYLDGEANVRAVTAMDLIVEYVIQHRDGNNTSGTSATSRTALTFLISPGTPHVISEEAAKDAIQRYEFASAPAWHSAFRFMPAFVGGFSKYCISDPLPPNNFRVYNGLSETQGPNYALSKCMQQWRAMLANSQGHIVSANVSPPAKTQSMVSHSQIAKWLDGLQAFPPMVAFDPCMARTLMTSLLIWDLTTPRSTAQQKCPHPAMLFLENSVHGGCWRFPYDLNSVGMLSFMMGKFIFNKGLPPREIVILEESDEQEKQ
mmetsp:Transcript_25015/g.35841  ORF Transcript_25015/g.35841 Transcript_25015/m.35841 type:complete len:581 (+) Transcript_25015:116-1858(+)